MGSRSPQRGIAVIIALIMSAILVMMVGALLLSTTGQKGLTLRYHDSVAALYVAEAGVAAAMAELSAQPDWGTTAVTYTGTMPNGQGTYSIVFDSDGNVEPHESVNNLANSGIVDGPRGPGSVPGNTADIVVTAQVDGLERRLEVLIRRGAGGTANKPLIASGKILLKGDVTVDGIKSLADPTQVDAGIHSNSSLDSADLVVWDSTAADTARISGEVTTSSSNPSAINMASGGGSYTSGGESLGASYQPYPSVDVAATVASNSSHPALTPSGFGTTTVPSGDYSFSGGVINGDLVLDGANVYVDGPLTINGSIKGQGSIYVNGDTAFQGDAGVRANDSKNVAVFSAGNVTLSGFDGTQFLEDLAVAQPQAFGVAYSDAKAALAYLQSTVTNQPYPDWQLSGSLNGQVEAARRTLGQAGATTLHPGTTTAESLKVMADYLSTNYGSDPTAQFLADKFYALDRFYGGGSPGFDNMPATPSYAQIAADYQSGTNSLHGAFNAVTDQNGLDALAAELVADIAQQDYDKLGASYFQGLIYTNGYIHASNEVEVIGGVYAEKTAASPSGPWVVDGLTVDAGDVFLTNGSSIIFNEELMQGQSSGGGPMTVQTWLGR